jgi:hypothetical protein
MQQMNTMNYSGTHWKAKAKTEIQYATIGS